jgi:hypothetical protein
MPLVWACINREDVKLSEKENFRSLAKINKYSLVYIIIQFYSVFETGCADGDLRTGCADGDLRMGCADGDLRTGCVDGDLRTGCADGDLTLREMNGQEAGHDCFYCSPDTVR